MKSNQVWSVFTKTTLIKASWNDDDDDDKLMTKGNCTDQVIDQFPFRSWTDSVEQQLPVTSPPAAMLSPAARMSTLTSSLFLILSYFCQVLLHDVATNRNDYRMCSVSYVIATSLMSDALVRSHLPLVNRCTTRRSHWLPECVRQQRHFHEQLRSVRRSHPDEERVRSKTFAEDTSC